MNCRGPTPINTPINQSKTPIKINQKFGAGTRIRTTDFLITNEALYQLSYTGNFRGGEYSAD